MTWEHSWIFVPGQVQRMVDKAFGLAADVVMLDLEDSVVPAQKVAARALVAQALHRPRVAGSPTRYVRINGVGLADCLPDLEVVVQPGLEGVVVPKVGSLDHVRWLDECLTRLEASRNISHGTVRLMLAVETPRALILASELAASSPRVSGLMFGAEDFSRALNLPTIRRGAARDLLYARSHIVVAAAAAGVASVDGVWPDLDDARGLEEDCAFSRSLGFTGKSLIHPSQIEPVNRAFRPTADEFAFAQRVVAEFEKAVETGTGSIAVDGQLVDAPIYERAKATVLGRKAGVGSTHQEAGKSP